MTGIRPAQAVALVPLAAGGLHASDLADRLKVSRQAVAQLVAALERHEYVMRGPHPSDARALIIELTDRGRQALRVMRSNALEREKRWRKILGRADSTSYAKRWWRCSRPKRVTISALTCQGTTRAARHR